MDELSRLRGSEGYEGRSKYRGPRENPTKWFSWGEDEHRNERAFAVGGSEGYGGCEDDVTWGDLKLAALQLIFSNDGEKLNRDDSNAEYLNAMPAVANVALDILTSLGVPLLKTFRVEITEDAGEPELISGVLRVPVTAGGVARVDMRVCCGESYRCLETGGIYEETAGTYGRASHWSVEGEDVLVLPADHTAIYTVYFRAYPQKITSATADDTELGVPREVAELVPLYIGAELYREDDIQISTQMRNEFEDGLAKLQMARSQRPAGGAGQVQNSTGWWN